MTKGGHTMQPKDWDVAAAAYARLREPLTLPYGMDTLVALQIKPGERLLDLATGTGGVAIAAASRGVEVVAVDWSAGMVAYLAARAKDEAVDGVTARVMDGQNLELPAAHFDAACSVFGIMFFPDHRAGFAELYRVLKPGGRVGVAVWQNPFRMEHLAIWERVAHAFEPGVPGLVRPPAWMLMESSEGLRQEMELAGFQDVSVVPMTHKWDVPSAQWFIENFDASQAYSDRLGHVSRDQVREAVLLQLQDEYGNGPFAMTSHSHIGIGVKTTPA